VVMVVVIKEEGEEPAKKGGVSLSREERESMRNDIGVGRCGYRHHMLAIGERKE